MTFIFSSYSTNNNDKLYMLIVEPTFHFEVVYQSDIALHA